MYNIAIDFASALVRIRALRVPRPPLPFYLVILLFAVE